MSSAGPAEAFTSREQAYLSSLPAVEHVTSGRIYYTEAFKKECVRRYRAGEFRGGRSIGSTHWVQAHRTFGGALEQVNS